MHIHKFHKRRSNGVEICPCGAFRFTEEYLKTHPSIVCEPPPTVNEVPTWALKLMKCAMCGSTSISLWFDEGVCVGAQCRSCHAWTEV